MSKLKKVLLGVVVFMVLGVAIKVYNTPGGLEGVKAEQAAKQEQAGQKQAELQGAIETAIRGKVKTSKAYGDYALEFADLDKGKCSVNLTYDKGPMTRGEAELICKAAVLGALEAYQAQGVQPARAMLRVRARVYTAAQGVTGQDQVNVYGVASYNYDNDQIEWTPEN